MADYIKRSDLHEHLRCGRYGYSVNNSEVHAVIDRIPSTDVAEVRHGKWLWDGYVYDEPYVCNCCGNHMDYESNFCPNCGAKMDGGT